MLLQTNSYIVPKEKRAEHARLMRRFRQSLLRLGCDQFEVYEQVGANWATGETTGRFVQIMRFRDRQQQRSVQAVERHDQVAQKLIQEFCELINFPYQQQQGLFAVGFYQSALPVATARVLESGEKTVDVFSEQGASEKEPVQNMTPASSPKPTGMTGMNLSAAEHLPLDEEEDAA